VLDARKHVFISGYKQSPELSLFPKSLKATVKSALSRSAGPSHRQVNAQLAKALARVRDAVITWGTSGGVIYMNAAAEALTSWRIQEAAGRPIAEVLSFVDTETGGTIKEAVAKEDADSASIGMHAVLLSGTDHPLIIEYSVFSMRDDQGTLEGSIAIFRDIMRRRKSELALQQSEDTLLVNAAALFEEKERAQVTLNSIGDAVVSTDFRGRVIFLNKIAEQMTGWAQADAAGRLLDEIFFLVDSHTREPVPCPAMAAIIEDRAISLGAHSILIRKDGTELAIEDLASPIHDTGGGVVGAVMVVHDVTEAREQSAKLAQLALYDSLTGLPNRTLLVDRLSQALERAQRNDSSVWLLFLDLDRFKPVNDSHGHATGDQLLHAVAARLLSCVRHSDTVCRYGGDEFVILLADIAQENNCAFFADKIVALINDPFDIGGYQLRLGVSIGIASYPVHAREAGLLIKYADIAMYQAKFSGRNRYQIFAEHMVSPKQGNE
jgi:diguanylate cyclase (GGDEF)-like protein/PAS domain S-box-containing protein